MSVDRITRTDHEITHRPSYAQLTLSLAPGESVRAEAGAMVSYTGDLDIETEAEGGLLKSLSRSVFGGESFFLNTFTANGESRLDPAPALSGDVQHHALDDETLFVQSTSFVASDPGIDVDTKFGRALFRLAQLDWGHLESPRRLGSRDSLRSSLRCGAYFVRERRDDGPFQSHPRRLSDRPPPGGNERGDSLGEGGRRKHASEASARSEAPDSSESGLSRWSQFHRLISTLPFGGGKTFFGGEGLFLLELSGTGPAFISSYGAIDEHHVEPGETRIVDTGHVVAFEETLDFEVERVGGLKSTLFSGEGLVCAFSGEGTVRTQTRSPDAFLSWLVPKLPTRSSSD